MQGHQPDLKFRLKDYTRVRIPSGLESFLGSKKRWYTEVDALRTFLCA